MPAARDGSLAVPAALLGRGEGGTGGSSGRCSSELFGLAVRFFPYLAACNGPVEFTRGLCLNLGTSDEVRHAPLVGMAFAFEVSSSTFSFGSGPA